MNDADAETCCDEQDIEDTGKLKVASASKDGLIITREGRCASCGATMDMEWGWGMADVLELLEGDCTFDEARIVNIEPADCSSCGGRGMLGPDQRCHHCGS